MFGDKNQWSASPLFDYIIWQFNPEKVTIIPFQGEFNYTSSKKLAFTRYDFSPQLA